MRWIILLLFVCACISTFVHTYCVCVQARSQCQVCSSTVFHLIILRHGLCLSPELLIQQATGILHFPGSRVLGVQCQTKPLCGFWCDELRASGWCGQHYTNWTHYLWLPNFNFKNILHWNRKNREAVQTEGILLTFLYSWHKGKESPWPSRTCVSALECSRGCILSSAFSSCSWQPLTHHILCINKDQCQFTLNCLWLHLTDLVFFYDSFLLYHFSLLTL